MYWIVHEIDRLMEITDDIIDVSIAGILNYLMVWNGELIGFNICVEITPPPQAFDAVILNDTIWWNGKLIDCMCSVIRFEHFPLKLSAKPYWESFL